MPGEMPRLGLGTYRQTDRETCVEVLCLPLKLRGGDGAPARILARRLGD